MMDANLNAAPAGGSVDLRQIDANLANFRRAERDVAAVTASLAEARDALAARPDDPEAARRVTMAELRMRAEAVGLSYHFAALAQQDRSWAP